MKWKLRQVKESIISCIRTGNINSVTLLICGCAFTYLLLIAGLFRAVYPETVPALLRLIGLLVFFLIFGFAGLVQIYRREAPGISSDRPVRGIFAVFGGLLIMSLSWGIGLWMIFERVKDDLRP